MENRAGTLYDALTQFSIWRSLGWRHRARTKFVDVLQGSFMPDIVLGWHSRMQRFKDANAMAFVSLTSNVTPRMRYTRTWPRSLLTRWGAELYQTPHGHFNSTLQEG